MNQNATQLDERGDPAKAALRFTYASGSRPLDGYTIKRGVGRGGFGEVYYAHSDGGKEVALKLIRRNLDVELRGVRHCLNLKHPNLLAIHDIRTDAADDRWVVMEFISGESLEQVIERNPNGMPAGEALRWIRGAAAGLAYLHDHGIVHRDLKPGNIFLDEGIVKIGDYGLSKFISCSRRSGQTESVGTVHYMAPEIANGRYGKEIDTYALGVMLYEMLTGSVPFEGESVGEVLMKHLTAEPDLSLLAEPYRGIVARALAKDPEQRIASAKELLAALPKSPDEPYEAAAFAPVGFAEVGSARRAEPQHHEKFEAARSVEPIHARVVDEEPLWKAVRDSARQLNEHWTAANFHPLVKVAIFLGLAFLAVSSAGLWFPLAMLLLICYGAYRVIRAVVYQPSPYSVGTSPAAPAPRPVAQAAAAEVVSPGSSRRKNRWHRSEITLPEKPLREKLRELTSSMLLAASVAAAMTLVMLVLRGRSIEIEQFVWTAIVGTLGSWAVLAVSKLWEGRRGEQLPRRFVLMVVGLAWGAAAFGLAQYLMVGLPYEIAVRGAPWQKFTGFYAADGSPQLLAFFAYFGFLMFLVRWWKLADPLRGTRLSVWATMVSVFWAWLVTLFFPFPQPWGLMLTAIVAVSVQLASPRVEKSKFSQNNS